jgi:uncharacterized protein
MKKNKIDLRLIIGFILSHVLFFFTFDHHLVFWYMLAGTMLLLISYSIVMENVDDEVPLETYLIYGSISGLLLFVLFSFGNYLFELFRIPIQDDISRLNERYSPTFFWHFLSLMLITVPGAEIFWRGFILKRLLNYFSAWGSIFISSLMYASVTLYTGEWLIFLTLFFSAILWGLLYVWKRSIPLVIVSHLVFDLFIFILYPF